VSELSQNPYEIIGPKTLERLVDVFYDLVAKDPDLSPIFPKDLTETKEKQRMFLTQFLGGPPLYSEQHGHPMLRARHMPFPVTPTRANAWLTCMSKAMDEVGLDGELRKAIYERLTLTAHHMVNTPDSKIE